MYSYNVNTFIYLVSMCCAHNNIQVNGPNDVRLTVGDSVIVVRFYCLIVEHGFGLNIETCLRSKNYARLLSSFFLSQLVR